MELRRCNYENYESIPSSGPVKSSFDDEGDLERRRFKFYFGMFVAFFSFVLVMACTVWTLRLLPPPSNAKKQKSAWLPINSSDDEIGGVGLNNKHFRDWRKANMSCGFFRDPASQLPLTYWRPFEGNEAAAAAFGWEDFRLPVYSTHNLSDMHLHVKTIVVVQHGNLRNANDYFCGAVNSFRTHLMHMEDEESAQLLSEQVAIVAPIFLIEGDLCWDDTASPAKVVNLHSIPMVTCNQPVWSNDGWKDGHLSLYNHTNSANFFMSNQDSFRSNSLFMNEPPLSRMNGFDTPIPVNTHRQIYSYDVFNMLIKRLGNPVYFPNLQNITLFGFSAGAQTLLRFAMMPLYEPLGKPDVTVSYVISDPSTFLYFDAARPRSQPFFEAETGKTAYDFGVPDESWILDSWKVDASGNPWITNWETQCSGYNHWRYGMESLVGYYEKIKPEAQAASIQAFQHRRVTYLVGLDDTVNCKLKMVPGCVDDELATYCQAMLQGNNRVDRLLKYRAYISRYFNNQNVHAVVSSEGVPHDPTIMMRSPNGACVIFGLCIYPALVY